jgi:hypothetical protein
MKPRPRQAILGAMAVMSLCLLCVAMARAQSNQAARPKKPLLAEEAFKNIQVLRGMPVTQFMATMGFFSASLGSNCTFCHVEESSGNWAKYADDNEQKQTARRMILMMNGINQMYFGGKRVLTCYYCHRGGETPKLTPSLAVQYGALPPDEPEEIEPDPDAPPVDQILNKYLRALGDSQRLAALTSFVAKGTYQGYDEAEKTPMEIYAQAPDLRTTIVHGLSGDTTTVYDGSSGWTAAPDTDTPISLLELNGPFLDAVRQDAEMSFPGGIRQILSQWRVGFPSTINDRDVQIVQGISAAGVPVRLYFDMQTGLLLRLVRFAELSVGRNPTQIDYSDYRVVAGVKMPFHWTVTWTDGRSNIDLTQVQPNVAIDPARFAEPAPPTARPLH